MPNEERNQDRVVMPPQKKYARGRPRDEGGRKPDFRIVQPQYDQEGNENLLSVGGIWKNTSEAGKEYFNVKIGNAKFLGFKSDKSKQGVKELPEYNISMSVRDEEGKVFLKSVGAMWKNVSKKGVTFYNLTFGNLRLLVFENNSG